MFGFIIPVSAAELQKFSNVTVIQHPANDGDSIHVKAGEKQLHIRLYLSLRRRNS